MEAQWWLADVLDPMGKLRWHAHHFSGADDPHLTVAEEEQRFALLDSDYVLTRPRLQLVEQLARANLEVDPRQKLVLGSTRVEPRLRWRRNAVLPQAAEDRPVVIAVPTDQLEHVLGVDPQTRQATVVERATKRRRIGVTADPRPRLVEHAREVRVALELVGKVPNGSHPRARYRWRPP